MDVYQVEPPTTPDLNNLDLERSGEPTWNSGVVDWIFFLVQTESGNDLEKTELRARVSSTFQVLLVSLVGCTAC